MPSQPLSSRLSLAQAVMSMGAKSKALNLGIQSGTAAGDEGWGEGQPKIKVMGREVRVMRRWGYEWQGADAQGTIKQETETETPQPRHHSPHQSTEIDSQETIKGDPSSPPPSLGPKLSSLPHPDIDTEPPLWALNLETLRSTSNTSALLSSASATSLPIYDPHSARAYLLKSFASAPTPTSASPNDPHNPTPASSKRPSPKKKPKRKNTTSLCSSTPWRPCSAAGLGSLDRKSWIAGLGDGMSE